MNLQQLMAMMQSGQSVPPDAFTRFVAQMNAPPQPPPQPVATIDRFRSPYERTLGPGEQRSPADLQAMLGEVILAAGSGAIPGGALGRKSVRQQVPARYSPANFRLPRDAKAREETVGKFLGEFHPPKGSGLPIGNLYRTGKTEDGKSIYKVLVVEDGQVTAESAPMVGRQLRRAGSYHVSESRSIDKFELNPDFRE